MSAPGFAELWSLDLPPTEEAPTTLNFGVWVANYTIIYRVVASNLASQLSVTPPSETRLRDEGIEPLYSFFRNSSITLKSTAHELGVTVPDFPDAPADWREDALIDYKALAALFRPHLAESARSTMDWVFSWRDLGLHWASRVAASSMSVDMHIRALLAMGGMMEDSDRQPFVAIDELKSIAAVIREEVLRIRDQPGSGWDEEEAKSVVKGQFDNRKELSKIGT